jgi:hypothetical protein
MGQSCFSKTGRAIKKHMVERFLPLAGSFDQNGQVLLHLLLADQIGQLLRAQGVIDAVVGFGFGV